MSEREPKTPDFDVYAVNGNGRSAYWQRIGGCWKNSDDSLNIQLTALPLSDRLCLRKYKAKDESKDAAEAAA